MLSKKLFNHNFQQLCRSISSTSVRSIDVPSSKPLNEERKQQLDEDKKSLKWRAVPSERKGEWYSKFKLFLDDDKDAAPRESMFVKLVQPIDLRPSLIKKWYKKDQEKRERFLQQFVPERHQILGNDLAAAHFLVFRSGKVKFTGRQEWTKMDKDGNYRIPDRYVPDLFLEAIDCEGVEIFYEGLENLRRLKKLRFLSFKDVKYFDDWSLDRVSGSEFEALEVLNLSGTDVTYRGFGALYRIPSLKKLIVDDPFRDTSWALTLAMLQEIIPDLEIVDGKSAEKPAKA